MKDSFLNFLLNRFLYTDHILKNVKKHNKLAETNLAITSQEIIKEIIEEYKLSKPESENNGETD